MKRFNDIELGVVALLIIIAIVMIAAYLGVDIDAGSITMAIVTAIAAFIRGKVDKVNPTDAETKEKKDA